MEVGFSTTFKRAFRKRVKGNTRLERRFLQKLEKFCANPFDESLKTHKLSGKLKELWSFSIEYDIRVLFYFKDDDKAVFIDIGSHKDVY